METFSECYAYDEDRTEYEQFKRELRLQFGKECAEDILNEVPDEYSRCTKTNPTRAPEPTMRPVDPAPINCQDGCLFPPAGCFVKGNITFDGGEKIYHIPGDEYYDETKINPSYGERWFCTAEEAEYNGWRRAESGVAIAHPTDCLPTDGRCQWERNMEKTYDDPEGNPVDPFENDDRDASDIGGF